MKTTSSLLLGLASSLLLTVGLTRAAERFDVSDPHAQTQKMHSDVAKSAGLLNGTAKPAPSCSMPCDCAC